MNLVPIIIQQTYFDGCVRDSQLWALEARMQVLLDEMTHLQEEDGIDRIESKGEPELSGAYRYLHMYLLQNPCTAPMVWIASFGDLSSWIGMEARLQACGPPNLGSPWLFTYSEGIYKILGSISVKRYAEDQYMNDWRSEVRLSTKPAPPLAHYAILCCSFDDRTRIVIGEEPNPTA
ncbi:unnamed protein product [Penicillium viridicatum]